MSTDTATDSGTTTTPTAAGSERIGRFSRAQLEAMRGKRGRKPPEYFEVFPEARSSAKEPKTAKEPKARKARAERAPQVSSAILGEHTIDELLAMIGVTGKKPVAYGILRDAAQIFADRGVLDLAESEAADPLARRLSEATPRVRQLVEELFDQIGVPAARRSRRETTADLVARFEDEADATIAVAISVSEPVSVPIEQLMAAETSA